MVTHSHTNSHTHSLTLTLSASRVRGVKGVAYESPVEVVVLRVVPVAHAAFEGTQTDAFLTRPHAEVIYCYMTSEYVEGVCVGRRDSFHHELLAVGRDANDKLVEKVDATILVRGFKVGE